MLDVLDMQKMQGRGSSRTGLGSTAIDCKDDFVFPPFFIDSTTIFNK